MTGDTGTVLLGLGVIALVLPLGMVILWRVNSTIERMHPWPTASGAPPVLDSEIPAPRRAPADESTGPGAATRRVTAAHPTR
jgi:hypothetical protein